MFEDIYAWVKRSWPHVLVALLCGGFWLGWELALITLPSDRSGGGGYEMHVVGAIAFTLFNGVFATALAPPSRRFYVLIGLWAGFVLTAEEVLQVFKPGRTVELLDAAAQVAGILIGLGLMFLIETVRTPGYWQRWFRFA